MNARLPVVLAAAALLAACAHAPQVQRSPIAQWMPSPNYDARRPMLIVIHATEEGSAEQALHTLRTANSGGPVSAHYLVGRDGAIYQLVDDADRAWQAGAGRWGAITELNSASIGIELDNDGETPFAPAEIASLIRLLDDLCTRLGIPRDAIIAHADLAPARKRDPGFRFPWKQLADAGFGKWPQGPLVDPPAGFDPWMALRVLGYPLEIDKTPGYTDTVRAFHRHYRGDENDVLDAEDARILYALTRLPAAPAATRESRVLNDPARQRDVPVELYLPPGSGDCTAAHRCPVALLSPGYGMAYTDYGFLADALAGDGYLVVAVQHDVPGDVATPDGTDLVAARTPMWKRGAENLRFVRTTLAGEYPGFDWDHLALVGHSNGGDISALAVKESHGFASALVTLDNRRYPLPRDPAIRVMSVRGADFQADPGVLPAEGEDSGICVQPIPGARHNDMNDHGPDWLKAQITRLVVGFLRDGRCGTAAAAVPAG
jgi:N-acetyl-anhydromuramyl-L-alanine amidase AmpD/predicted dienelactone hydrolase